MILTSTGVRKGVYVAQSEVPEELLTGSTHPRVRVDLAQTGFFENREFRAFWDGSIAAGTTQVFEFIIPVNIIVFDQSLGIDNSSILWSAWSGGSPSGTFGVALPVFHKNEMLDAPAYTGVVSISTGGGHTGGTQRDVARLVSNQQGNSAMTVGGSQADERGLAPGTYYARIQNYGSVPANVTYKLFWEERP